MKKVGILTMYHNSLNCGGNLQSYALTVFLRNNGFDAEQISYQYQNASVYNQDIGILNRLKDKGISEIIRGAIKLLRKKVHSKKYSNIINLRRDEFHIFNKKMIPHSINEYNESNINSANNLYDIYITGSDQVWNMKWYDPTFFLSFVDSSKFKMSYAASLSMKDLTKEQEEIIRNHIKDFNAISVREKDSVKILGNITIQNIEYVLDPTLLLERKAWDEICADRIIKEDYIFCCFLGTNIRERKAAKRFAKKNSLKLVSYPFANGDFISEDLSFGDIRVNNASPQKFLSLIKNAKYVFTDSFHTVVFSYIYEKQYFAFRRSGKDEMSSRMVSIMQLFNTSERFCNNKIREKLNYIELLNDIDYTLSNRDLDNLREHSISFLLNSLKEV